MKIKKLYPFFLLKSAAVAFFFLYSLQTQAQTGCDNVTNGGSISANQTIAAGSVPSELISVAPATGGTGDVEYLWMSSTIGGAFSSTNWTPIPSAISANYQPGSVTETTYFIRCARIEEECTEYSAESNIIVIEIGALPVELSRFTAETKGQSVVLDWTTESEINHDYFSVEVSTDGIDYTEFTTVKGDGFDRDAAKNYTAIHRNPTAGVNYYRLRQTDRDGTEDYSQIVKAEIIDNSLVAVSPNPVFDLMTVRLSELPQSAAVLTFYHAQSGQRIQQNVIRSDTQNLSVDTSDFTPGLYFAVLTAENGARLAQVKFVKAD